MAHGVGQGIKRGLGFTEGESGWYLGEHRGSDVEAKKVLGMGNKMRRDFGASSPDEIADLIAEYNETGVAPGRLGDILKFSGQAKGAIKGEYGLRKDMAGVDTDLAKLGLEGAHTGLEMTELKETGVENFLTENLTSLYGQEGTTMQKTGGISGPTRGATQAKAGLREKGKLQYETVGKEIEMAEFGVSRAELGVTKAGYAEDILDYQESGALVKTEQDKLAQINQIKDLIYDMETMEMQYS